MMELRFYTTIKVDDECFNEDNYESTMYRVKKSVRDLAIDLDGVLLDLEIK